MTNTSLKKYVLQVLTRPFLRSPHGIRPTKEVAIVVPIANKAGLTPDEEISLCHLRKYLGRYDRYLVKAKTLDFTLPDFKVLNLEPRYFGSAAANNRMHYWPQFYWAFADYKYILIYHLDSLAFSDQLMEWCQAGFDYIGAPWMPCKDNPFVKEPAVGNGGFTLMNIRAVLEVLYERHRQMPSRVWEDWVIRIFARQIGEYGKPGGRRNPLLDKLVERLRKSESLSLPNDMFWGYHGRSFVPHFKVADWRTALRFAFETVPTECLQLNGGKLPFGCHSWGRYDRSFWNPFLLTPSASPANVTA